jgi:hypothetical protein
MSRFPGKKRLLLPVVCLVSILVFVLVWGVACSRPAGIKPVEDAQTDQNGIPFQGEPSPPPPPPENTVARVSASGDETGLPFRSRDLPAGTLIAVRLKEAISADEPVASGTFNAVVDQAILIEGSTVLPRGAVVAGRVESSLSTPARRSRGYVRLKLDAIDIAGHPLPLQTASLFVSDDRAPAETEDLMPVAGIHIERGRRLTFRLIEPLSLETTPPPHR